ncbi:MAG: [protein-PII] uridylyltransferase [Jatrophihabitantaceae bacterium]
MTATPSESLRAVRDGVLRRPGLLGAPLRAALADAYDAWLGTLVPHRGALALAAVGGLGRRDCAPYSDLDLVLLHTGAARGVGEVADASWYPIWDSGIGLDHSVRTPEQALAVAKDDLKAMLGLLDLRHIAGERALTDGLRSRVLDVWRAVAAKRLPELQELSRARWSVAGDAAFLLEPNLKDSRGGLRDAQIVHALAAAQLVDLPVAVREAYPALLDVRGELHRRAARAEDVLRLQELDGVAAALHADDRDAVLRRVNEAARTVSHAVDLAWRRIAAQVDAGRSPRRRLFGTSTAAPVRVGLGKDVVAQDGEVVLARDAQPGTDPQLLLRVARAAAEHDLSIAPFTLARLAAHCPPLPVPWPEGARAEFVSLLGAGPPAVAVLESLDLAGLLVRLIPEWAAVRCKAQHNPVHRFTVDRHLLETAAHAATSATNVARPDLLVVGALLHDIGKGYPGDHSIAGAEHAANIARRMGFGEDDAATVAALARHHLLLPDTATRRDLDDPVTVSTVADALGGSAELLELLHALSAADAAATGPAAWSDWKAALVADLVRRVRAVLEGDRLPPLAPLDAARRALAEAGRLAVEICGSDVVVAAPDSLGVLYRTAGVLALHSLDVRSASIRTYAGMAVNAFVVQPRFGRLPDAALVRSDLARALDGNLGLAEKLREKERSYARAGEPPAGTASVHWFDDAATDATVLEFRASDAIGLLYRLTAALERCQLDVRTARVSSVAGSVVDAFYLTGRDGRPVPPEARAGVEAELARV